MGAFSSLQLFLVQAPPDKDISEIHISSIKEFRKFKVRLLLEKYCFTLQLPEKKFFMIGRVEDTCPLYFSPFEAENLDISAEHCFFYFRGGSFYLRDNDSTNGTWYLAPNSHEWKLLQGKRVRLKSGAQIRIGDYLFKVLLPKRSEKLSKIPTSSEKNTLPKKEQESLLPSLKTNELIPVPGNSKIIRTSEDTHQDRQDFLREILSYPTKTEFVDGKYNVKKVLGKSEWAVVYKVKKNIGAQEMLAVKISEPLVKLSDKFKDRLTREEKLLLTLQHPSLLEYKDIGLFEEGGVWRYYHFLPYFNATTLKRALKKAGRLRWEETYEIAQQIANALFYLHLKGLAHRDLNPTNILYDNDPPRLKFIDFGGIKFSGQHSKKGIPLLASGTTTKRIHFLAPEQLRDIRSSEKASDLYALGAILYFCLTGQFPYEIECASTNTPYCTFMREHLCKNPPCWNEEVKPHVPEKAIQFIHQLLSYSTEDRPSAETVLNVLNELF